MDQTTESRAWRVLVINPGSTTKVGLFDGEKPVFTVNVAHEASELAKFAGVSDQLPYRLGLIEAALVENGVDLCSVDAFVGRGGGLLPLPGGTYEVDDVLLDHSTRGANGVQHPAQLGPQIAHALAARCGRPAFVVNPPDTDELCDEARMTGVRGVYRHVHLHALNLKETAIRHALWSATSAAASPSAPTTTARWSTAPTSWAARARWPPRARAPCPWPRS